LPPGDYDVHAVLTAAGKPVGRVVQAFSLRGPAGLPAAAGTVRPALVGDRVWTLAPAFSRDVMLGADLLGRTLRDLEKRSAGARSRAAIDRARGGGELPAAEAAALSGEDPLTAAFLSGVARFRAADLEQAANHFRDALRAASDFYPAAVFLGACYAAGGKDREAAGAWQTALIEESDSPAVFRLLVDALLRLRDASGAVSFLEEAAERWPDDPALAERRVMVGLADGRTAEALGRLDGLTAPSAPLLFAAMNLLHDALVSKQPIESREADAARLVKYAERYRAAGGTEGALVDKWLVAAK
jgi:tetratricopeptide (TPR) repeat protein